MPATPNAKLLATINGGAPTSGGITTATGVTVQFSGESTVGWIQQRFELYDYPAGFAVPAGWSTDPNSGAYFYAATDTPPPFSPDRWGKYMGRLTVNNGLNGSGQADATLVDASTALSIPSPSFGLVDLSFLETNQFDPMRNWVGAQKANLRVLDTSSGSPGVVAPTASTVAKRDTDGSLHGTSFSTSATLASLATAGVLRMVAGDQVVAAIKGASHASVPLVTVADSGTTLQLGDGVEIDSVDALAGVTAPSLSIGPNTPPYNLSASLVVVADATPTKNLLAAAIQLAQPLTLVRASLKMWIQGAGASAQIAFGTLYIEPIYALIGGVATLVAEDTIDTSQPGPPFALVAAPTMAVTGAADNGSGKVRLAVDNASGLTDGNVVVVASVGGTVEANGTWPILAIDATHVDLPVAFVHAWTSGGTATPQGAVSFVASGSTVQIQANSYKAAPWTQSEAVTKRTVFNSATIRYDATSGQSYICSQSGTTSNSGTGPTGTGIGIVDGTAHWDWICAGQFVPLSYEVAVLEVV